MTKKDNFSLRSSEENVDVITNIILLFRRADLNGDGRLSVEEIFKIFQVG